MGAPIGVSVVIPAHDAENTLARALNSVLAQTRRPAEVIVVDDFSSDRTVSVAEDYRDRGIVLIRMTTHRGAAAARNVGVAAATGEWIAFLDADDEWLPPKLEKQAAMIDSESEPVFVFCASEEVSADGRVLGDTFHGWPVTSGEHAWKALLANGFVATPTVLARRKLLLDLGGFDEKLWVGEDQDMWIRLALSGPIAYVPENLVRVHLRACSLSAWRPADQPAYTLQMIERHLSKLKWRLTKVEQRRILGERLINAGLMTLVHGQFGRGLKFILRAALLGHRPLHSLALAAKAPMGTLFKRVMRGRPDRHTEP
jgi:glycosyltransferase involved in cell wall biosynthesis